MSVRSLVQFVEWQVVTLLKCVVRCPVRIFVEILAAVIGFIFFQTVQANVSILTI